MAAAQKRIGWLDAAKGLSIFLVVLAHAMEPGEAPPYAYRWIAVGTAQAFFFLSGLFFKPEKYPVLGAAVMKRARMILWPYLTFSAITYTFWLLVQRRFGRFGMAVPWDKPLVGIISGTAVPIGGGVPGNYMQHNGALWFLPCLFVATVMYYLLHNRLKKKRWIILALVACSALAQLDGAHQSIRWPWGLNVAFSAVVFFGAGCLIRDFKGWHRFSRKGALVALALCLSGSLTIAALHEPVNMNVLDYGHYVWYHAGAFMGVASIMAFCYVTSRTALAPPLQFLGRNTLPILGLHFIGFSVVKGIERFVLHVEADNTFPWALANAIWCILIILPAILVMNRWFRWVIVMPGARPTAPKAEGPDAGRTADR